MDDQTLLSVGLWIKRRRKALDLTQDALAAHIGCSKDLIVKIEGDARRPSREIAALLATQLQLAPEEREDFIRCARAELAPDRLPPPSRSAPRAAFSARPPADHPRSNLPAEISSFVGREQELADLRVLLARADVRLLTLTGTGGAGKARLALAVVVALRDRFSDGVFFIDLAPLAAADQVVPTIAQVLGVRELVGTTLQERLREYLQPTQLLLLLDNFEHLLVAAPLVADLLRAAPKLTVLVTSRVGLRLSGEHEYAVLPLALPPLADDRRPTTDDQHAHVRADTIGQYESVRLFSVRAQAVKADFAVTDANAAAVAAICRRLDGLPLAIELAAARVKLFTATALLARLDDRLGLLTSGARDLPARQQTIRNAIDWSYTLLTADEQSLFRRPGVFVGGWTLEAAEAVCAHDGDLGIAVVDGLSALVDHSLVRQEVGPDGEPRFTMLETLREYALERLAEVEEATETRRRHAEYFVALAEAISAEGGEWEYWDERTRIEYANLRDVLGWCRTAGPGGAPAADLGMRLARALRLYWHDYDLREGLLWLRELCGPAWRHGPAHLRARLLSSLGQCLAFSIYLDDRPQAPAVLEEGLRLSREIGDMWALAEVCRHRGEVAFDREDLAEAEVCFAESLTAARTAVSPWNIAWTQFGFGRVAMMRGEDKEAARLYEECLRVFHGLGYVRGVCVVVGHYSAVLLRLGDLERAAKLLDDALGSARVDWPLWDLVDLHDCRGQVAYAQSDLSRASQHFVQALRFDLEAAQHFPLGSNLKMLQHLLSEIAVVAAAQGHHAHATRLLSHAPERFYFDKPNPVQAQISASLAACRAALGEEAFQAAWAEGRALTLEQALAEALNR
jgi:predicted ATPase/transcriptional regulator with XRE-family HTH domain